MKPGHSGSTTNLLHQVSGADTTMTSDMLATGGFARYGTGHRFASSTSMLHGDNSKRVTFSAAGSRPATTSGVARAASAAHSRRGSFPARPSGGTADMDAFSSSARSQHDAAAPRSILRSASAAGIRPSVSAASSRRPRMHSLSEEADAVHPATDGGTALGGTVNVLSVVDDDASRGGHGDSKHGGDDGTGSVSHGGGRRFVVSTTHGSGSRSVQHRMPTPHARHTPSDEGGARFFGGGTADGDTMGRPSSSSSGNPSSGAFRPGTAARGPLVQLSGSSKTGNDDDYDDEDSYSSDFESNDDADGEVASVSTARPTTGFTSTVHPKTRHVNVPKSQLESAGGIEHWQRGDLIGSGSYGQVYSALNLATGETMAVKLVKLAEHSGRDKEVCGPCQRLRMLCAHHVRRDRCKRWSVKSSCCGSWTILTSCSTWAPSVPSDGCTFSWSLRLVAPCRAG